MSDCPVCGEVAKELLAADYDGRKIDCGKCGRFDVTGTACSMLEKKDIESRLAALEKAKRWCGKGGIPEINASCF